MKMYRTKHHSTDIEVFKVIKITEKQLTYQYEYKPWNSDKIEIREQREAFVSTWQQWHNTKEDAIKFLLNNASMAVSSAKHNLQSKLSEQLKLIEKYKDE